MVLRKQRCARVLDTCTGPHSRETCPLSPPWLLFGAEAPETPARPFLAPPPGPPLPPPPHLNMASSSST